MNVIQKGDEIINESLMTQIYGNRLLVKMAAILALNLMMFYYKGMPFPWCINHQTHL